MSEKILLLLYAPERVKTDLLSCDIISIAVDESTIRISIGRLAIIIRFALINSSNVNKDLYIFVSINDDQTH